MLENLVFDLSYMQNNHNIILNLTQLLCL